jgi:5,5'-dehydrodivanillate O-demethylase
MLVNDKNRLLTEVGPGTPAGDMLRRYWHPIALTSELTTKPRAVRVLGEDLVLYRGESGQPYLIAQRCPHRGTSLTEGRLKGETIRCCYHGWLFDGTGRCLEQPGEPLDSGFAAKVRIAAHQAQDRYGMIWAYLGAGEPPVLPPYDILARKDGAQRVAKASANCSYFQVLENSVDPVHTAILHLGTDLQQAYEEIPQFDVERTDIGVRTIAWRPTSRYRRHSEFAFPTLTRVTLPFMKPVVQMGFWMTPVDDTHCEFYFSWFLPIEPGTDAAAAQAQVDRMEHHMFELQPDDRITLSSLVVKQDVFACESQGAIVDRSAEMLGHTDRGVILLRQAYTQAMEAVERGGDPPGVLRGAAPEMIPFDRVT